MADGKVTIDTELNNKGLDKGLKDSGSKLKDFAKKTKETTKKHERFIGGDERACEVRIVACCKHNGNYCNFAKAYKEHEGSQLSI